MRFLADENFPLASYHFLKSKGFDITHIGLENPSVMDNEVIELSIEQNRIIITFDSDFGELVFRMGFKPIGIVYFRWKHFSPSESEKYLNELLQNKPLGLEGYFTVIDLKQIRQRQI